LSSIGVVGFGAVAVVVVLWLVVSFLAPGRRRDVLEWLAATGLFVALGMLFLNLILRAREADNTFALVAFGFLGVVFASGFCVSLVMTLRSLRGPAKGQASSTN
jgi:hypothetical protein